MPISRVPKVGMVEKIDRLTAVGSVVSVYPPKGQESLGSSRAVLCAPAGSLSLPIWSIEAGPDFSRTSEEFFCGQ